ncbi:MAG: outer membrane lipoprotein-sorting protein [Zetaproteobacteria bacterium CG_4_9_14_3_um_filter_49_83]|nr:MAG: outer membrane lipoprotein-sorting protein [Zetaproteobacteria bacterium CG1_02_49_23]PIQ34369.1 MAG: outer membrane lipoprotein-sorting protein [Zetaproteobacteria bacterium CG17_big_fil_post_rev_8_21_14_2_50_50_13]PIV30700.1 MAG: outer membrane lipoprotein-sorting protein [Zetaproteobacteria bacterium CG02_land_8_20_14_3_00_50_9]PIY57026.1 MAG: outer membrane lipoprotein-sorting protein [Zetaproteobacteria bacterium CG_4_10_14_0_8_um_filter_49_80]PJA33878.1 MAG: outer membrane lipopro
MKMLLCLLALFLTSPCLATEDNTLKERTRDILNKVDDLWRGESSYAVVSMQVKTEHYSRNMRMEGWSKGKEKTLFRVLEPLREKGTMTLKSDNHIFTYLPKTDRTIRLTSGMMMGSWMGSHLTNDDLVKEARLEEDYDAEISFEGMRDNQQIIEFTLTPKADAPVVWGKLSLIILADGYTPLVEMYYDEDMALARTFIFSGMKMLGGRERPAILRVTPADKPDEFTEFIYEKLELNIPLSDAMFSKASLKNR